MLFVHQTKNKDDVIREINSFRIKEFPKSSAIQFVLFRYPLG